MSEEQEITASKMTKKVEDACRDLNQSTLAGLPDLFSRLVFLSSLRDISSNDYSHWGLENTFGKEAAQKALEDTHLGIFRQVSALPLRELSAQVKSFLAGRKDRGKALLQNWQRDFSYNLLAPARAGDLEMENFRINFDAVMSVAAKDLMG